LEHVNDLADAFMMREGEVVVMASTTATAGCRSASALVSR
jgi:hypothetical protein